MGVGARDLVPWIKYSMCTKWQGFAVLRGSGTFMLSFFATFVIFFFLFELKKFFNDKGELEESMAELEESRRKLAILQMHKHGASTTHASIANAANGSSSPDKSADRTMGLKDLKDSIEEAKV